MPALVIVLALVFTACSTTPTVHTQPTPGTDYGQYHTFAMMPLPTASPVSDPGLMSRISVPARQAATEALVAKGLAEVDSQRADIEVNMKGQFLPRVKVTDWGYMPLPTGRAGLGSYQGGDRYRGVSESDYEERILTIEIFDNRTKAPIWVGWSKRDVKAQADQMDVEKLKAAIADILSEFPAGSAKSKQ